MKTVITDLETLVGQGIDAFEKASIDKVYIFFRDDAQVPFSLMMKIQKQIGRAHV